MFAQELFLIKMHAVLAKKSISPMWLTGNFTLLSSRCCPPGSCQNCKTDFDWVLNCLKLMAIPVVYFTARHVTSAGLNLGDIVEQICKTESF